MSATSAAVGFTLSRGLDPGRLSAARAAQQAALRHFPHLGVEARAIGETALDVWGWPGFQDRLCVGPDGVTSALVGAPHGSRAWNHEVPAWVAGRGGIGEAPPWDGRTVLVAVSPDGRRWDLWNDWVGSLPVFYARVGDGWVVSSLEPVVVAAAQPSADRISPSSVFGLLVDGHFLSTETLFDNVHVLPPDSRATWSGSDMQRQALWSVAPSTDRWEASWDALVDEQHELATEVVRQALSGSSRWVIPLSGGLDSRLIAGIATRLGIELTAFSWGGRQASDVVCARRVARQLGIPWTHVDIGDQFLATQFGKWADLFGSAMHMHGMYQVEFFARLRASPGLPVVSGYLGDVLNGTAFDEIVETHAIPGNCQIQSEGYIHWDPDEVMRLLRRDAHGAREHVREALAATLRETPGAFFQRSLFLEIRHRQCRFTGFSPWLADYERGCVAPFVSRAYGRFCASLPRAALFRRLIADMFRRYYPRLAALPGTFADEPYQLTGRYLLKRRLARHLPVAAFRNRFGHVPLTMDLESARTLGWRAVWPVRETWQALEHWLDMSLVERVANEVFAGSDRIRALRRLQSVQTLAYRLNDAGAGPGEASV